VTQEVFTRSVRRRRTVTLPERNRLKDATDLDRVRADLADVVSQALEPAHVTVWTARDSQRGQQA
jgi:hypothetical protein